MDSNNDKLKNIASVHNAPVPYGSKKSLHKKKSENFLEKKSGEWTISKKIPRLFKKSTITRPKNKTGDRKEASNDSPESSDNEDIR